jgi:polar amino acid transport system substrate-binding protein
MTETSPADPQEAASELAPTGTLRAAINLGNPVLAHGTPDDPGGITIAIARELSGRLGVPIELNPRRRRTQVVRGPR